MKIKFSKSDIKIIRILCAVGLAFFFILFLIIQCNQTTTSWELFYKNKSEKIYNGKVVKKYINKKSRSTRTIILDNNSEIELLSTWYDKFDTGDLVFKEKGSLIIKLIKKSTTDTLFFDYRDIEIKD
ncbi:MAG: hypothetical protein COS19_08015 [Flavobacteriaceae bacterium CG02_land_8_20_14_3_00_34_13]|nr:MAG: hypothetical protein COS19_08015 [Flavobacteriaceae bacterium CG02_land_8_20_14_3_00_34_13]